MATFLYYIPNGSKQSVARDIAGTGIGYAFGEPFEDNGVIANGPDGGRGHVVRVRGKSGDLTIGYYKERQTWRKVAGSDAWVGFWNDARPVPSDLIRPEIINGSGLQLRDGNEWTIPLAQAFLQNDDGSPARSLELPTICEVDDNGNWKESTVDVRCRRLWEIAESVWPKVWQGIGPAGVTVEIDERDMAVEVLSHNYRIGKTELSMLGLCTREDMTKILLWLIDWPSVEDWLKKKIVADIQSES